MWPFTLLSPNKQRSAPLRHLDWKPLGPNWDSAFDPSVNKNLIREWFPYTGEWLMRDMTAEETSPNPVLYFPNKI